MWCLADFLDSSHHWPPKFSFFSKISSLLGPLLETRIEIHDMFCLNCELTQVFRRVLPNSEHGDISVVSRETIAPTYGVMTSRGPQFFLNLRKQDWQMLLQPQIGNAPDDTARMSAKSYSRAIITNDGAKELPYPCGS
ncbi:unnamed protein product [Phytophthora lilii]|uniref:Unnamed protein product n=1 Tax=Phytophthora lilii TaxID=2077276 RepID=A0A9W7CKW2_9STRA|nr:unnamed protein product [Phytophthora lilii]